MTTKSAVNQLMKIDKNAKGGHSQLLAPLKRSSYFEQLDKLQEGGERDTTRNVVEFLKTTKVEGMLNIRFESGKWRSGSLSEMEETPDTGKKDKKQYISRYVLVGRMG